MLADPSDGRAESYLHVGQRETWRKMPMLATRLRIANALREVLVALEPPSVKAAAQATSPSQAGGGGG